MTCAGLASVPVCMDNIQVGEFLRCSTAPSPASKSVEAALGWLEANFGKQTTGIFTGMYYNYGIERVGLATGMKFFGTADWYKVMGKQILGSQQADGGWPFNGGGGFVIVPPGTPAGADPEKTLGTAYARCSWYAAGRRSFSTSCSSPPSTPEASLWAWIGTAAPATCPTSARGSATTSTAP